MAFYNYQTSHLMYLIDAENSTGLKKLLDVYPPHSLKPGMWYKLMQKAVSIGNFDVIQVLIWDFHINNLNKHPCETPLHKAVLNNDSIFISALLSKGGDASSKNELGDTPLHLAIEKKNFDIVRILLNGGADLNAKNNFNVTPLSLAVHVGNFEIFEYLLNRGPDINTSCTIADLKEYTPLHLAVVNDSNHGKRMIEHLLKRSAEINALEKSGFTALHLAILKERRPIIDLLLDHTNIKIENNYKISPLCIAAALGDFKTVSSLINQGALINTSCDYDNEPKSCTVLHLAARNGNKATLEILLKEGADVQARNEDGETPLHIAVTKGNIEAVELLVQHGADVHSVSPKWETGFTLLHQAIVNNKKEIVNILISGGADINSDSWMLPIHYAALNDCGEIIKILLDNGVYVDTLDRNGKTPLNIAIHAKKLKSIEWILKYCPNLKCQTVELGFVKIVEKLLKLGVCPNTVLNNDLMYSMLHIACLHRQNEVVKLLINNGADINCRDHQGKTPLFYAVHNSDRRIIKILIRNHADINVKAGDGRTPLSLSVEDVDSDIITLLLDNGADIHCNINYALNVEDDDDTDDDNYFEDYDAVVDYYYEHQHQNEDRRLVAEILQKQIILLKTANFPVDREYLSLVDDVWGFTEECKKEIETMKKNKVHDDINHVFLSEYKSESDPDKKLSLACKIVNTSKAPQDVVRKFFPRELDILMKLDHPHVVQIHSIIQRRLKYYIFMQFAESGDLLEYITKNGPVGENQARIWLRQLTLGNLIEPDISKRWRIEKIVYCSWIAMEPQLILLKPREQEALNKAIDHRKSNAEKNSKKQTVRYTTSENFLIELIFEEGS
ncbi:Similar to ANK3: Ankyrin-3 (Homo sapiens) [Cotesia congregata]|uniref:Similar to ANK3: Ankyrin-3 (Homo sapiens) n=1 Tax=Cotesia congregata TaxID=51543 RepID=A0A8J2HIK9_COTCN|nr:Similar to ANK3: Ankyrin-3 (Homo sapiens) [Cotesia congregata]